MKTMKEMLAKTKEQNKELIKRVIVLKDKVGKKEKEKFLVPNRSS